ncbi:MAG: DUF1631 family protein [Rhodoferax sp.]|nr:DUF1631 family protein [Rhodoferax sp.]
MHTPPSPSTQHQALYQSILKQAAADGSALMGRLVMAAIRDLHARASIAKTRYERDTLANQSSLLQSRDAHMRALYSKALLHAFTNPELRKKATLLSVAAINFEQLELMDEHQVHESVAVAHAQQAALQAADSSLADLNTLICAAQGLQSVRPESNPLRTEAYVSALKSVMDQINVPDPVRLGWLASMSAALGPELHALYQTLSDNLRQQGVVAVGYTVVQAPASTTRVAGQHGSVPASTPQAPLHHAPAPAPQRTREEDETLLTLDKLRSLLAGELDAPPPPANRLQSFSQQFDQQFGDNQPLTSASGFSSTMPAALEALADMQQLDQVVQRLEHRRDGKSQGNDANDDSPMDAIRDVLRRSATSVAQGLSLEVVTLMVDNIVRNPRLLKPIQQLVAELEPALLLLSLVDPRFFTDKTHPARELLQEITDRSLAYESEQASGFAEFLADLQRAVEPLNNGTIENAEPFEQALASLRTRWQRSAKDKQNNRDEAVRALQHAEQRNLLAASIARSIEQHHLAPDVPQVVLDFLCGPWAQVVAQARLAEGADSKAMQKYHTLIADLLWSANPALTRNNIAKLTRLVPQLLSILREGLNTIHYPTTKASAFLAELIGLHQQAFRGISKIATPSPAPAEPQATPAPHEELAIREDDPWIAPAEAKASNFMEWTELPAPAPVVAEKPPEPILQESIDTIDTIDTWSLGTWVELLVNERWVRTQLTWTSQQGSLFLFTSVSGTTQSMTRRSRDKLIQSDRLRLATTQTVVDGALDAVASIAMRNSVDTTY